MDDQTALVPIEETPQQKIARGKEIATALASVINDRHLYKVIQDRKYVMVEGWTTLGGIIGVVPREVSVERQEDGGYIATVELVRMNDLAVIGKASALCGMDEPTWAKRAEYARRSMAVTRATGKAYRLGYSWIVKLAGYEGTPAEEMPSEIVDGEVQEVPIQPERPYSPAALRNKMTDHAMTHQGKSATEAQLGLAMGMLNECFAGDDHSEQKRHTVLMFLFGVDSGAKLLPADTLALLDWLKPKKDSGGAYTPDPMAVKEAQSVVVQAMKDAGQGELI